VRFGALSIIRLKCTFGHCVESTGRAKAHPWSWSIPVSS
jgi:hypothetical protein